MVLVAVLFLMLAIVVVLVVSGGFCAVRAYKDYVGASREADLQIHLQPRAGVGAVKR